MPDYGAMFDTTDGELDGIARWVLNGYEYCGRDGHGWARFPTEATNAGTPVSGVADLFSRLWGLVTYQTADPDTKGDTDPFSVNGGGVQWLGAWWDLPLRWRILFPNREYRYCGTGNPLQEPIFATDGTAECVLLPTAQTE